MPVIVIVIVISKILSNCNLIVIEINVIDPCLLLGLLLISRRAWRGMSDVLYIYFINFILYYAIMSRSRSTRESVRIPISYAEVMRGCIKPDSWQLPWYSYSVGHVFLVIVSSS